MAHLFDQADDLDLLRRIAIEADETKQLLRRAGFGVTGIPLLQTDREALDEIDELRQRLIRERREALDEIEKLQQRLSTRGNDG